MFYDCIYSVKVYLTYLLEPLMLRIKGIFVKPISFIS